MSSCLATPCWLFPWLSLPPAFLLLRRYPFFSSFNALKEYGLSFNNASYFLWIKFLWVKFVQNIILLLIGPWCSQYSSIKQHFCSFYVSFRCSSDCPWSSSVLYYWLNVTQMSLFFFNPIHKNILHSPFFNFLSAAFMAILHLASLLHFASAVFKTLSKEI